MMDGVGVLIQELDKQLDAIGWWFAYTILAIVTEAIAIVVLLGRAYVNQRRRTAKRRLAGGKHRAAPAPIGAGEPSADA